MKYALLNYSGNVGKTTIARDVIKHNLPNYELISVESVNADGKEDTVIKGEDGDKLFAELLINDDLILDIGSSNLEYYLLNSAREKELIENIDIFIIPVTPERKQQMDSLKTMRDLLGQSVPASKIRIIFNQVPDNGLPIAEIYEDFLRLASKLKITTDTNNVIYKHDLYSRGECLAEMLSDVDYRAEMESAKAAGDIDKGRKCAMLYVKQKKIRALNDCYTSIFTNIIGKTDV